MPKIRANIWQKSRLRRATTETFYIIRRHLSLSKPNCGFEVFKWEPKLEKKKLCESGFLYFIGKDGYVWAAPMKHNKTGKKKKVGTEKIAKEKGHMYYIGKDGFVAKAKMKNA
jgi:hypothetical protein